jgi:hypothetical protein
MALARALCVLGVVVVAGLTLAPPSIADGPVVVEFDPHEPDSLGGGEVGRVVLNGCGTLTVVRAGLPVAYGSCPAGTTVATVAGGLQVGDVAQLSVGAVSASVTYDGTPAIGSVDRDCDRARGRGTVTGTLNPTATQVSLGGYTAGPLDVRADGALDPAPSSLVLTGDSFTATFSPGGFTAVSVDQWTKASDTVYVSSTARAIGRCAPPSGDPLAGDSVKVGHPALGGALHHGLAVVVACPGGCHASLIVRAKAGTAHRAGLHRRTLARAHTVVAAGKTEKVRLRFARGARRKLAALGKASLAVSGTFTTADGSQKRRFARAVTLRRRPGV